MSSWKNWKESLGDTRPWDMLNANAVRVTQEEADARFNICLGCPELIKITKQCKKCLCYMPMKTRLKSAACPIGKW